MSTFPLKIVTPDGLLFDGQAEKLIVRTTTGDTAVLAKHIDCVAALGMGMATVVAEGGQRKIAACIGGMLSVQGGNVTLVPTTFEWAESIDAARALASQERAEKVLRDHNATSTDIALAEARLHRALVRKSVASFK